MNSAESVESIVERALCCGCGACARSCPSSAIVYIRNVAGYIIPKVDRIACIQCGKCLHVCPSVDIQEVVESAYADNFRGKCINGYVGYAANSLLRSEGQSGGLLSAFLIWMLREGKIDGAIVNRFNNHIQRNEAVYADTEDGILAGVGSYYAQSPVVDAVLANKGKRLAVVTLGCQAEALSKLRKHDEALNESLVVVGLVCGGNYSGDYIDDLIDLACRGHGMGVASKMRFRSKENDGWPGNVAVWFDDAKVCLPSVRRIERKELYIVPRCRVCCDRMNLYADVVFVDPWGIKREDNKKGNTVAITRTEKGDGLFAEFLQSEDSVCEPISPDEINLGQRIDKIACTNFSSEKRDCKFEQAKMLMLANNRDDVVKMRKIRLKSEMCKIRKRRMLTCVVGLLRPIIRLSRALKGLLK